MVSFWKVQRNLSGQAPSHKSKKKGLQPVYLTSKDIWMPNMVSYKSISKETWNNPTSHGRKMPNVKLKNRIRNTIIRQIDIVQYVTSVKWKWAGYITQMKDNRCTIRSTEWQIKGIKPVGRPKRCWWDDCMTQGAIYTDKDSKGQSWSTLIEGYFLQWKDTA